MKEAIDFIIEPITHILNQSLSSGIVPREMNIAKTLIIESPSCFLKITEKNSLQTIDDVLN